jgi:hypothetical protein
MPRTLCVLAILTTTTVSAYEPDPAELYGRGVHAYFSGQPRAAWQHLTAAIDAGAGDPRAHYFRGLVYQQLGRPDEAQADFRAGADLERQDARVVFAVDRALERVQGWSRLAIERHRTAARALAAKETVQERNRRIQTAEAAQEEVTAPRDEVLIERSANFGNLPDAPVKAEVDQPFNNDLPGTPPPKPAQGNPLQEAPPEQPARPATPPPPPPGAPAEVNSAPDGAGTTKALGNALKRAFGGIMSSLPEAPAGLPLGGQNPRPQP